MRPPGEPTSQFSTTPLKPNLELVRPDSCMDGMRRPPGPHHTGHAAREVGRRSPDPEPIKYYTRGAIRRRKLLNLFGACFTKAKRSKEISEVVAG